MSEPFTGRGNTQLPLELRASIWDLIEQYLDQHPIGDPGQQGILGWSFDPCISAGGSTPSLGVEYMVRVIPTKTRRVANVHLNVSAAATTPVSGQCFVGLRNAAGTLLAKSATAHGAGGFGGTGNKVIPFVTPVDLVAGTPYWVCWVINAAATATILRAGTSDMTNTGCPAGQGRVQTLGSGLTDLAAGVTMTGADQTNQHTYWVGLS